MSGKPSGKILKIYCIDACFFVYLPTQLLNVFEYCLDLRPVLLSKYKVAVEFFPGRYHLSEEHHYRIKDGEAEIQKSFSKIKKIFSIEVGRQLNDRVWFDPFPFIITNSPENDCKLFQVVSTISKVETFEVAKDSLSKVNGLTILTVSNDFITMHSEYCVL